MRLQTCGESSGKSTSTHRQRQAFPQFVTTNLAHNGFRHLPPPVFHLCAPLPGAHPAGAPQGEPAQPRDYDSRWCHGRCSRRRRLLLWPLAHPLHVRGSRQDRPGRHAVGERRPGQVQVPPWRRPQRRAPGRPQRPQRRRRSQRHPPQGAARQVQQVGQGRLPLSSLVMPAAEPDVQAGDAGCGC